MGYGLVSDFDEKRGKKVKLLFKIGGELLDFIWMNLYLIFRSTLTWSWVNGLACARLTRRARPERWSSVPAPLSRTGELRALLMMLSRCVDWKLRGGGGGGNFCTAHTLEYSESKLYFIKIFYSLNKIFTPCILRRDHLTTVRLTTWSKHFGITERKRSNWFTFY